jgi:hypothetical protein
MNIIMKLEKKEREAIAKSEKILSVIGNKLHENKMSNSKIDVASMAKKLAERRERIKTDE